MRYCQAEALVKAMLKDATFARTDPAERKFVTERILENVRGRMLEEIVLLETMAANPKPRDVFEGRTGVLLDFPLDFRRVGVISFTLKKGRTLKNRGVFNQRVF